jgi:porin
MTALIAVGSVSSFKVAAQAVTPAGQVAPRPEESPRVAAEDSPLTVLATYISQAAGNLRGGLRRDAAYAGRILISSELDLDRVIGVPGAVLHAWFTNRQGSNLADTALGTSTGVQEIYSPQASHLSVLSYEQALFGGRLELEAGRTPANVSFFSSPLCAHLQTNSACGSPTFLFKTSNLTYFPPSSWGARAKAQLGGRSYVQVGVYEVNPDRTRPAATGLEWSVKNATGVIVPFQFGYSTAYRREDRPGTYEVGGWYDAAAYKDPVEDDGGGVAVLSGRPYATRYGRSGMYVSADQVVWQSISDSERSLRLFGLVMMKLSGRVVEDRFLQFGLLHTGTFPRRRTDTIAFVINDQAFSRLALRNIWEARASVGDAGEVPRHQIMMELAYGARLTERVRVSPNIHYIVNPDQLSAPFRTERVANVLAVGLKLTVEVPLLR